jgi:peptide/nickel transport system ATP-binding protein
MLSKTLLEIKNLTTEFKTKSTYIKAVDNISFNLNKAEILGIVGESGSGKSVTSLSVMQLLPLPYGKITNGQIIYHKNNGESVDILKISEKEMRRYRGKEMAMIFQEPMTSLNPVFTCGNQVAETILLHQKISKKQAKEKTLSLFEEVQLHNPKYIFKSYPHQLSGGQKQRVMIAMAISCKPSILIADEPTTALDVTVQKNILDLIKQLQKKYDTSVIFITHDLAVISELADYVIVMYKGKIVEKGNTYDILHKPKHPYTKGLLACRPPLNKHLKYLPTIKDFMNTDNNGVVTEKQKSITAFVNNLIITDEQRKKETENIYTKKPVLQVKNLKTFFSTNKNIFGKTTNYIKAVNNVSFNVYPGETLGLVGESGCGKTTLGRALLQLIKSGQGQVIYKDADITKLSNKELRKLRKNIQIIFQDPYSSLNPHFTAGEAIMEPMKVHGIIKNYKARKNKAIELLKEVDMDESHFYRYPHEFSGGQRQRICIARALSLNPEFIVCDESVSALDVSIQAQVLNLLNKLKKEFNFTYIFISHDLSVVKFMSDRMLVMKDGKIQEIGDADQIYSNPETEYTKKLISSIPRENF